MKKEIPGEIKDGAKVMRKELIDFIMGENNSFESCVMDVVDDPLRLPIIRADGCFIFAGIKEGTHGLMIDESTQDSYKRLLNVEFDFYDMISGIAVNNVGHNNIEVKSAVKKQVDKYAHVMVYGDYLIQSRIDYANALSQALPHPPYKVFFTNSGTEAIDGAIKLAWFVMQERIANHRLVKKLKKQKPTIIAFDGGFHGRSIGASAVTSRYRKQLEGILPEFDVITLPYGDFSACAKAFQEVEKSKEQLIFACIIEPIQGEAGVIIPKATFISNLRVLCHSARDYKYGPGNPLLILDEVQTGMGRTGYLFNYMKRDAWASKPDILVTAKAFGGGYPLGAFITNAELAKYIKPLKHLTTFGGHPVSCAAGLAAFNIIKEEKFLEEVRDKGHYLNYQIESKLDININSPHEPYDVIQYRYEGLLGGLVMSYNTDMDRFYRICLEEGVILGHMLHDEKTLRIAPPLTITKPEIAEAVTRIKKAIEQCKVEEVHQLFVLSESAIKGLEIEDL